MGGTARGGVEEGMTARVVVVVLTVSVTEGTVRCEGAAEVGVEDEVEAETGGTGVFAPAESIPGIVVVIRRRPGVESTGRREEREAGREREGVVLVVADKRRERERRDSEPRRGRVRLTALSENNAGRRGQRDAGRGLGRVPMGIG